MPFCNRFTKGDKYDRSVEVFVSKAAIGDQFIIQKTGPGWIVSLISKVAAGKPTTMDRKPIEEKKPPAIPPGNKEKKDAKQRVPKTGRTTPRRRGGVSER